MVASEYQPGSVKLGCAFIKHHYWYLRPIMDPVRQIRFHHKCAVVKDRPLFVLTQTPTHPFTRSYMHRPCTDTLLQTIESVASEDLTGEGHPWVSTGLTQWKQKKENKKTTPPLPPFVVMWCPVCNEGSLWARPALGEGELG